MAISSYVPPSGLPPLSLPVQATDILVAQRGQLVGQVPASALVASSGSGGSVLSVFGRTGLVVAQPDDYNIAEIAGAGTMATQDSDTVAIIGGTITGMPTPTQPSDVSTKTYVDAKISALGTMATQNASAVAVTGGTITGLPAPVAATDVAIKSYVDGVVYTVSPTGGDDTAVLQAAHNAAESALGGVVTLLKGATYIVSGGLLWDPRLVGLEGNGATLDCSGIVPGNVGTDLVTGNNSTFTTSTGSWTFTNANGYVAIQTVTIGGTVTVGDTLTITATSASITGSPIAMTYTVVTGDTLLTIAAGLARTLVGTSQMQTHGVVAAAASAVPSLCIYITQSIGVPIVWSTSVSGGATETISNNVGISTPTGMLIKNTTSQQGYGILAITTVPGTTYCVNYEMHVVSTSQINCYAQINQGADSYNYSANQSNTWYTFIARSTTTYIQAKVSVDVSSSSSDSGTFGQLTVQVGVPPAIWHWDRSDQFANIVAAGTGYTQGDYLTIVGGSPSLAATIVVAGVDGSGHITYAQIHDNGTYPAGGFPTNPVSVTGGTGTGAMFTTGIATPQFGHEAYPLRNFLLVGPGRSLSYVVDSVTPFSLYSSATAAFGISLNSNIVSGQRNSTSSRGMIHNVLLRNFTVGVGYLNQAYLLFTDEVCISNTNIGWMTTNGANAGENLVVQRGWVTGCDLLVVLDAISLKFDKVSLSFPRQANYRINGASAVLTLNECHEEFAPPGKCASGSITFASNPANGSTITLNGVVWTFVTGASSGAQTQIQAGLAGTMTQLAADLKQYNSASLVVARYSGGGSSLTVNYRTGGTAGNAYTLAASAGTPSGATLTGGVTNPAPIIIAGTSAAAIVKTGGEMMVTGTFPADAFNQLYLTTDIYQSVIWNNVFQNNLSGFTYLMAGPANANIATPSRVGQFPTVPQKLSDAEPRSNFLDIYGQGGFETPPVASSTIPNGLIFLTSTQDDVPPAGNNASGFPQNFSARNVSQRGSLVLSTAASFRGAQSLAVTKIQLGSGKWSVYILAPCKPGYLHWWDFMINVPAPGTPGTPGVGAAIITLTQDYVQLGGIKTIFAQSTNFAAMTTGSTAGFSPAIAGTSAALGIVATGLGTTAANPPGGLLNPSGGILLSNNNGTNGWMNFQTDTFNHGYQKAPAWADHIMLRFDLTNLTDAAVWNAASGVSFFLDEIFCWQY